ncbi:SEL1-like repeat protein (plasmid) [Rhizobium sp. T1470]|uniref:SEL1-like repeat protein n=1 Tax=unclassified Rhizobium TaxID=2613769 RepID=UPI001AAFE38A|nr:SEL1-like repeat protein [Rhizobium sp. T1473]MCA0804791.1 SEL1-like repeat protein [Rhizobium sp. T1473]
MRPRQRHFSILLAAGYLAVSAPIMVAAEPTATPAEQVDLLIQQTDGEALLRVAKQLRGGLAVSADNPLRVPNFPKARQALETAVTLPGARQAEAKLLLAKMMLAGEGGPVDVDRALALLDAVIKTGNAEAAYIRGQKLASLPSRDQDARDNLNLALRLGDGAAAFELAKLSGATPAQAAAMTSFGLDLLRQRVARGDAGAAFDLGGYYRKLSDKAEDQKEALAWYRKAAQLGQSAAVVWVARLLGNPDTPLFDPTAAVEQYQTAARDGSIEAAQELVRDFADAGPLKVPPDVYDVWIAKLIDAKDATAVLYYSQALQETAEQRRQSSDQLYEATMAGDVANVDDLIRIGESFRDGAGVVIDQTRAASIFRLGVRNGSNAALTRFAHLVIDAPSLRSQENVALALEKLSGLAAKGSVTGQLLLGDMYAKGVMGQVDETKAIDLYHRALAAAESVEVLNRLAEVYLSSADVNKRKKAFPYIERASRAGSESAMLKEAEAYADGEIVGQDFDRAVALYKKAISLGATDALVSLANLYLSRGGETAFHDAHKAFSDAIAAGNREAPVEMARFLKANGKLDEAIDRLTAAARKNNSSAAVELYEYASERAQDPNVGAQWLRLALKTMSDVPREKVHLASVMLMPSDIRLNLQGAAMLRELSGAKIPGAAVALSSVYIEGKGDVKDVPAGLELLEQASQKGDVDAILKLGDLYMDGKFVEGNGQKAVNYYRAVITLHPDDPVANLRMARAYREGRGVERNLAVAATYLKISSDAGSRMATRDLGLAYIWGSGVERQEDTAVQLLRSAAEHGFAFAWHDLAETYGSAIGPEVDASQNFRLNMRGAREGHVSAMIGAGVALLSGFGTQRDPEAGILWLERASASSGWDAPDAMHRLAEVYKFGVGVGKDPKKAREWELRAANAGSAAAMFHLALDLEAANTDASKAEAIKWLQRARALQHVQAAKKLKRMGAEDMSSVSLQGVEDNDVEE